MVIDFAAQLWKWAARPDTGGWMFVALPVDESEVIRQEAAGPRRGFGAVRVQARIGLSTWRTSIFPDQGRECYVLPVKKKIREQQGLAEGDTVAVSVEVLGL